MRNLTGDRLSRGTAGDRARPADSPVVGGWRAVIVQRMKTAVSIPDDVFHKVERLARGAGRSRSEVHSAALIEYVARHAPDEITDAMDRVCAKVSAPRLRKMPSSPRPANASWSATSGDCMRQGMWADSPSCERSSPTFRQPVFCLSAARVPVSYWSSCKGVQAGLAIHRGVRLLVLNAVKFDPTTSCSDRWIEDIQIFQHRPFLRY